MIEGFYFKFGIVFGGPNGVEVLWEFVTVHGSGLRIPERDLHSFAAAARAPEPVVPVQLLDPAHRIHTGVHVGDAQLSSCAGYWPQRRIIFGVSPFLRAGSGLFSIREVQS